MSNTKTVMSQAANTQGLPLDITDVFSTYLYTGTGAALTINNGIDLDGEGGLVWIKNRDRAIDHGLYDTERGENRNLRSEQTAAENYNTAIGQTFNSDGFGFNNNYTDSNYSGEDFASWTFRKAPKFFDVVTYTGDGTSSRSISHNLGCEVGSILVKRTDSAANWMVFHRSLDTSQFLNLNTASAVSTSSVGFGTNGNTTTTFSVGAFLNGSGQTYVAYLFAHNDGDGEFGPSGDQDIIKCGSYTGTGSTNGPEIDLGFEPQWVMVKRADAGSEHWAIIDNMRQMISLESNNALMLKPNNSEAEEAVGFANPLPTGFKVNRNEGVTNASGGTYIYMAIRRGPLAPPESATEVFAIDTKNSTGDNKTPLYRSGFPIDLALLLDTDGGSDFPQVHPRLTSTKYLRTNNTAVEQSGAAFTHDFMNGFRTDTSFNVDTTRVCHMWKRAPGFFDVVAYTGTGSLTPIGHNLGVEPELAFFKRRNDVQDWWAIQYPEDLSLRLNTSAAGTTADAPTYGAVTATTMVPYLNTNGLNYVAYLFATLAGVSKVGSYTGNGSSQTIDCGFTSGARFVLIKRTSSSGQWYVWDTERGIIAGNDPSLTLNLTNAQNSSYDDLDPHNSGFIVNDTGGAVINTTNETYIFYAIA